MKSLSHIESSRLVLRPFTMEDCPAVLEYQSNPEVVRYVPWPVRDAKQVEATLAKAIGHTTLEEEGDYLSLALERRSDGRLVGQMNAMHLSHCRQETTSCPLELQPLSPGESRPSGTRSVDLGTRIRDVRPEDATPQQIFRQSHGSRTLIAAS